jgi:uncharacterized protein (DUF885 family)
VNIDSTRKVPNVVEQQSTELTTLGEEFFHLQNTLDPLGTTLLGIPGYDDLLPDPSREGARRGSTQLREIEERLDHIDRSALSEEEQVDAAVLKRLAWGARTDLEEGIWEADASSEGYASPHAMVFMCVPAVVVSSDSIADHYLTRLSGLGDYFDAITERYALAQHDGRYSTKAGIARAVDQLQGHLNLTITEDLLANPSLGPAYDSSSFLADARRTVEETVRPAIARLVNLLNGEMSKRARDDDQVGIRFVPGGSESYLKAVRRHTTTDLSPEEIHEIGLNRITQLRQEFAELGEKVLGETDVPTILARLREDPALRFSTSAEIVAVAEECLDRAESTRDAWFPEFEIANCIVEEVHPIEARNAALAHYRPPAADGSRPGAHCILTLEPEKRFRYEYEALSFHESSPGHHLQIATAQTLTSLPAYRRYLDVQACAFVEGWGLYAERLADEMGLYSSDLARLGMLSFDALRACRLVVDTGMHHLGWSRAQAVAYMWENTATTEANVSNEIDRYIGWPGQALAYMVGKLEIQRLRRYASERLGRSFNIRGFHGAVLSNGAVPLDVLQLLVDQWIRRASTSEH